MIFYVLASIKEMVLRELMGFIFNNNRKIQIKICFI